MAACPLSSCLTQVRPATFFNLASVVSGCVALAYSAADIHGSYFAYYDGLCKRGRRKSWPWAPTNTSYYYGNDAWDEEQCKARMHSLLVSVRHPVC